VSVVSVSYKCSTIIFKLNVSIFFIINIPDEGYSRNVLCALNLISTFLQSRHHHHHLIKCYWFSSWYICKIAHLALNNNHSLMTNINSKSKLYLGNHI